MMINVVFRWKSSSTTHVQGNTSLTMFTGNGVILRLGERWLKLPEIGRLFECKDFLKHLKSK